MARTYTDTTGRTLTLGDWVVSEDTGANADFGQVNETDEGDLVIVWEHAGGYSTSVEDEADNVTICEGYADAEAACDVLRGEG